ncbi:hypothetical protein GH5_07674 [Leishmania sp. Ghana 2012 LV757]|uniref:hypothetical protein n=1 Tax=Leishmania sp. Ghana 2012 LV757 TaxID=2803181 RepID=UPI001B43EF61|nr:hypothetical protein GH5_07674 [Leishmania sp. Ghana 2012 LV757]
MQLNSSHEFGPAVPPTLPHYHHQQKPSSSPRECDGSSPCNTEILTLAALRPEHGICGSGVESASCAAAMASEWVRVAALNAVPSSMRLFAAPASEAPATVVVRDADSTPMTDGDAVFSDATATPTRAPQPCESVTVDISTAAVSLESSSSATTSSHLSSSLRPLLRTTATSTEDDRIQSPPPAAAATVAEAHLERHVASPCMVDNATATFYTTRSPPSPVGRVDPADRGASAAAIAAPLLHRQEGELSLPRCTPRTTPPSQGRQPAQATRVIPPTDSHKAPVPLPAPTTTNAAAAAVVTGITATSNGIASSSTALATHPPDHDSRTNTFHGTLSRMSSVAPAFRLAPQQQSQLSFPSSRSVSGRLDASPTYPPRTSWTLPTAAATHTTTAATPSSLSGTSKMQLSSLRSTTSPAATISRAASVVPSPFVPAAASEALTERTYSAAGGPIDASHSRMAPPPPPFPCAKSDAVKCGSPPSLPPAAVAARTGVAVDAVGYRECERDTLWRVLTRFFAALLLPHVFLWYAIPSLFPHGVRDPAAEAAAPPRVHLHAVSRNHPEVTLFALELCIAALVCWSLVRLRQISNPKSSREHHNLCSGLHTCSIPLAASPSSKVAGLASVIGDTIAEWRYASHLTAVPKKYVPDSAVLSASTATAGLRLSSLLRRPRLRPLRNPSAGGVGSGLNSHGVPGSSSNPRSNGYAHRIFFHPPVTLQSLPAGSLVSPRSVVTTAMRAATSGSTTPVRDLATVSRCPSESGSSMRRVVSNTGGGSSTTCTTTPSVSPHRRTRLTPLASREASHGFGETYLGGSPLCPVSGGVTIATWPNASDAEDSRPQESLLRSYNHRAALWDVPPLQQQSRERFSGIGAGCPTGSPASPMTPSTYSYTSAFSVLPSAGHASVALTGLGNRDGNPTRGMSVDVVIQPSVVTPTEAASAARTDSCLLSPIGAATAAFTYSPSTGRDGHVPTMTHFGLGLGFLVCTGLATWRLSLDYYFACYSFEFATNAALWFWLIPVSLLGVAAYVVLLIGGHTLRRRALRQLQDANSLGSGQGDEGQEEAARRVAAAAAVLRRLRWMAWCLSFVPYPQHDAALPVDVSGSVIMRPDAASLSATLASGGPMLSGCIVEEPNPTLLAVSLKFTTSGACDGGDDAVDDDEVGAAASALLQQSNMLGLDEDKDRDEVAVGDEARGPVHDVLRVTREVMEGQSTPVADPPGGVGDLTTATACGGLPGASLLAPASATAADFTRSPCNPLMPQLPSQPSSTPPPSVMPSLSTTGRSTLSYRGKPSNFSLQSLRTLGQRLQRILATVHIFATLRAWIQGASHLPHIPDFLLRLQRLYSLKQQHRAERQRRQRARVAAPAERQLWIWRCGELFSLERAMVWTYLIMLFLFFQALFSVMYFTWSWRSIVREAAMATMYATDTASAVMPVPPSFEAYSCSRAQLHLRNVLWFLPPFCVGHSDSVSSSQPSTTWSMSNQVALLLTLLGQRRFELAYLYTNVALPIGFVSTLYLFLHEAWLHLKSRRVLRLLALAKSRVETARKVRDVML